jgi:hypothetical protein
MNEGKMFWGIAALIEITQMWKNRFLGNLLKNGGGKLLERARSVKHPQKR